MPSAVIRCLIINHLPDCPSLIATVPAARHVRGSARQARQPLDHSQHLSSYLPLPRSLPKPRACLLGTAGTPPFEIASYVLLPILSVGLLMGARPPSASSLVATPLPTPFAYPFAQPDRRPSHLASKLHLTALALACAHLYMVTALPRRSKRRAPRREEARAARRHDEDDQHRTNGSVVEGGGDARG